MRLKSTYENSDDLLSFLSFQVERQVLLNSFKLTSVYILYNVYLKSKWEPGFFFFNNWPIAVDLNFTNHSSHSHRFNNCARTKWLHTYVITTYENLHILHINCTCNNALLNNIISVVAILVHILHVYNRMLWVKCLRLCEYGQGRVELSIFLVSVIIFVRMVTFMVSNLNIVFFLLFMLE